MSKIVITAKLISFRFLNVLQAYKQEVRNLITIGMSSKDNKTKDQKKGSIRDDVESSSDEEAGVSGSSGISMDLIKKFFAEKLSFHEANDQKSGTKIIEELNFDGLINHWKNGGIKNVITMVGAGVSTSAGIPDFRSPDTGLYNNLEKYNLPYPQAIFELKYFENNPKPFFVLAKELYPGTFKPTASHYFIKLLNEKGLLLRHYTQNIDTLERIANIPEEKLVEAHGTFFTNHCLDCDNKYDMQWAKEEIFKNNIPKCEKCDGIVKPDIVFFGENLPNRFYELPSKDFKNCDLLIIMGTSLEVHPFASLVDKAGGKCLRLLINRDKVGQSSGYHWFLGGVNLAYDSDDNTRDIAWFGDCDDGVYKLADGLGWGDELKEMVKSEHARIDAEAKKDSIK